MRRWLPRATSIRARLLSILLLSIVALAAGGAGVWELALKPAFIRSVSQTRQEIARRSAGARPVPAWLEVLPTKLRILVHGLPARQVIDTPVQEQLIVELYSK